MDSEAASELERAQSGLKVHLPVSGLDPAILDRRIRKRLAECDGVLFYQGSAGAEWLFENYGDFCAGRAAAWPVRSEGDAARRQR